MLVEWYWKWLCRCCCRYSNDLKDLESQSRCLNDLNIWNIVSFIGRTWTTIASTIGFARTRAFVFGPEGIFCGTLCSEKRKFDCYSQSNPLGRAKRTPRSETTWSPLKWPCVGNEVSINKPYFNRGVLTIKYLVFSPTLIFFFYRFYDGLLNKNRNVSVIESSAELSEYKAVK